MLGKKRSTLADTVTTLIGLTNVVSQTGQTLNNWCTVEDGTDMEVLQVHGKNSMGGRRGRSMKEPRMDSNQTHSAFHVLVIQNTHYQNVCCGICFSTTVPHLPPLKKKIPLAPT